MAKDYVNRDPSNNTHSTLARSFSASLNDAFAMDNNLDGLVQSVEQKKQAVSSQNAELEALEAKLRETEERLKEKSRTSSPTGRASGTTGPSHARQPLGNTFNGQGIDQLQQSSGTGMVATSTATPASGPVSASTMSHWRPAPQETSSGSKEKEHDLAAERLNGQKISSHPR